MVFLAMRTRSLLYTAGRVDVRVVARVDGRLHAALGFLETRNHFKVDAQSLATASAILANPRIPHGAIAQWVFLQPNGFFT
jgi:hypothetical protein